jgi:hypothetical protein
MIKLWEAWGTCSAGEMKWTLSPSTPPQWIQAVTSHSKTTRLGTTKRVVQPQDWFGTT